MTSLIDFGVMIRIINKRTERYRSESDLTHTKCHTKCVAYLRASAAGGLQRGHSYRLSRVITVVSYRYYLVAQTVTSDYTDITALSYDFRVWQESIRCRKHGHLSDAVPATQSQNPPPPQI